MASSGPSSFLCRLPKRARKNSDCSPNSPLRTNMSLKQSQSPQRPHPTTSTPKRKVEKKEKRKVCLFGLSANPPTGMGGHAGIVSYLSSMKSDVSSSTDEDGRGQSLFDEIRVLPVYKHMFSVSARPINWTLYRNMIGLWCNNTFIVAPYFIVEPQTLSIYSFLSRKEIKPIMIIDWKCVV